MENGFGARQQESTTIRDAMAQDYFTHEFSSDHAGMTSERLAVEYAQVDFGRQRAGYRGRAVGDRRFFVTQVRMSGAHSCAVDPQVVLLATTAPGFGWVLGRESGNLATEPAVCEPHRPYRADSSRTGVRTLGLAVADLTRIACMLYGRDTVEIRFDGTRPIDDAHGRLWVSMLKFAAAQGASGCLENDLTRAEIYRLLAVVSLETFRLRGDVAERHLSAERRAVVYRAARDYLEENALSAITIDDAAASVGASTRELGRAFRWYARTTPTRYLRGVRLGIARDWLRSVPQTADSAARVAAQCGFPDTRVFDRVYRAEFGVGPLDDA